MDYCKEIDGEVTCNSGTTIGKAKRVLQNDYKIDPNRLIAAGRGEYSTLASNDTKEGRAINRRTRILILPKLDQFYDLLNPAHVPAPK